MTATGAHRVQGRRDTAAPDCASLHDVLVLYTDGIVEATDERQEMFGEARLGECIRRHTGRSATEIVDRARAVHRPESPG